MVVKANTAGGDMKVEDGVSQGVMEGVPRRWQRKLWVVLRRVVRKGGDQGAVDGGAVGSVVRRTCIARRQLSDGRAQCLKS
jgi:hypothetical protein